MSKGGRRRERARKARRRAERRRRQRRVLTLGLVGVGLLGLLVAGVVVLAGGGSEDDPRPVAAATDTALAGEAVALVGGEHVSAGTQVEYNSNPPACGDHWPEPAAWGAYPTPLPDEQAVHNLEHGGIWISHKLLPPQTVTELEAIAAEFPQAVILSPRPENDAPIALASWCRVEELDSVDEGRIRAFISANINQSPEPLASFEEPAVRAGAPFPDFGVTDVDGRTVAGGSLRGKPAILWWTTTYCVPCQVGAREVARLDDELGGDAFEVLVLFVDPAETPDQLRGWREQFAGDDWMLALDTALAERVELRFLDTKILLDRQGTIQDIDVNIADQDYLGLVRRVVEQGG